MGVPTLIIARTDADAASLITSDIDEVDRSFLTGKRTSEGFAAIKHQSFVGTGYFDYVQNTVQQGSSSTTAMDGSTEEEQF